MQLKIEKEMLKTKSDQNICFENASNELPTENNANLIGHIGNILSKVMKNEVFFIK